LQTIEDSKIKNHRVVDFFGLIHWHWWYCFQLILNQIQIIHAHNLNHYRISF